MLVFNCIHSCINKFVNVSIFELLEGSEEDDVMPTWMVENDVWEKSDLDFFTLLPQYRVYSRMPRRSEIDWYQILLLLL